jgi:outer membrane protease
MKYIAIVCVFAAGLHGSPFLEGQSRKPLLENYSFSTAPLVGFLYGTAEEIVYKDGNRDKYLSLLAWNMEPLFYFGGRVDLSPSRPLERWGFFFTFTMKFGLDGKTGNMEDRDWETTNSDELTCYSIHDNITEKMTDLNLRLGVSLPFFEKTALKLFGEFLYTGFSFTGMNGYSQRGTAPKQATPGLVITYTQNWFVFSPGFSFLIPFHRLFSAELEFSVSPFIYSTALDRHFETNAEYRDYMGWGLFLEPAANLSFSPNDWFFISLGFSFRYIEGTKGISNESRGIQTSRSHAGAGLSRFDITLGAGARF